MVQQGTTALLIIDTYSAYSEEVFKAWLPLSDMQLSLQGRRSKV